jgi:hypothetical protein
MELAAFGQFLEENMLLKHISTENCTYISRQAKRRSLQVQ